MLIHCVRKSGKCLGTLFFFTKCENRERLIHSPRPGIAHWVWVTRSVLSSICCVLVVIAMASPISDWGGKKSFIGTIELHWWFRFWRTPSRPGRASPGASSCGPSSRSGRGRKRRCHPDSVSWLAWWRTHLVQEQRRVTLATLAWACQEHYNSNHCISNNEQEQKWTFDQVRHSIDTVNILVN